jgi:parallel beta-helix repeat protein
VNAYPRPSSHRVCLAKGTKLNRSTRVRAGKYAIPVEERDHAVLIEGEHLDIEMIGVKLSGGNDTPWQRRGIGILIRNSQDVELRGGTISGYRTGIKIENSRGVRVSDCDVSNNFDQKMKSTPTKYDPSDWLDIFRPRVWRSYGFGILAFRCADCSLTRVKSSCHQNGIGLDNCRRIAVQDCDVSHNSGWGIWLWASSGCTITSNKADHCVRCESEDYSAGGDSAGIILSHRCCGNVIARNSFTHSGDGFFLNGLNVDESTNNLVAFNDGSHSPHNAFESTFSRGNVFLGNIASNSRYGMWLGLSYENRIIGNIIENNLFDGIAIEHAHDNSIIGNEIRRNRCGIALLSRSRQEKRSRSYRICSNTIESNRIGVSLDAADHILLQGNHLRGNRLAVRCDNRCSNLTISDNNLLSRDGVELGNTRSADLNDNYWGKITIAQARRKVSAETPRYFILTRNRRQKLLLPQKPVLVDCASAARRKDHSFVWYTGLKRLVGL